MPLAVIFMISMGLATDAFAVSATNGVSYGGGKNTLPLALSCGLAFGIFQAGMTTLGYFFSHLFEGFIRNANVIAFILLSLIGLKMINDALKEIKTKGHNTCDKMAGLSFPALIIQALATSIDALAVGISLGVMNISLPPAAAFIGAVTFICCFTGVYIGRFLGAGLKGKAQVFGGAVLIMVGLNILFGFL
jgi:putative Mn2+ efflux pump MntP